MAALYRIDVLTRAGVKQAEVHDFLDLVVVKKRNAPGLVTFSLRSDHQALQYLAHGAIAQLEVWRCDPQNGIAWYREFVALHLETTVRQAQAITVQIIGVGVATLLAHRINAWRADTTDRTSFTGMDVGGIMYNLVLYNLSVFATVGDGRLRDGVITGINAAYVSAGPLITRSNAYKNVLKELQELAELASIDFELRKTAANTFLFQYAAPTLGVDRRTTLRFAMDRGNMANPVLRRSKIDEASVAIAAGQGEENLRNIQVRTGTNYSASNDIEVFADARNEKTTAGVQSKGDQVLAERAQEIEFDFDVQQIASCTYGVHYCVGGQLGDLVRANFLTYTADMKIVGVRISVTKPGEEKLDIDLKVYP
jgi:hypothetical protein